MILLLLIAMWISHLSTILTYKVDDLYHKQESPTGNVNIG